MELKIILGITLFLPFMWGFYKRTTPGQYLMGDYNMFEALMFGMYPLIMYILSFSAFLMWSIYTIFLT